jgi:hypothetical protein
MFLAQLLDNLGARGGIVAQHFAPNAPLKLGDDFRREAVRISGEGLLGENTHHLPMPGDGVFAFGIGLDFTVERLR